MPLNNAALQVAGQALAGAITHVSLHTAAPDATGSNQSAAGRKSVSWSVNNGDLSATNIAFTGGAASGPVTHVGFWSAATGGTFYGSQPVSGDQAFNAAGEYTLTNLVIDGSST